VNFDPETLARNDLNHLRKYLDDAGYATGKLAEVLGIPGSETLLADVARNSFIYADDLGSSPASILARLFLLCAAAPANILEALPKPLSKALRGYGLVEVDDETKHTLGKITISEVNGYYYLADRLFENRSGEIFVTDNENICMPPHASSLELMKAIALVPHGSSVLDIGCGSGCLTLPLAQSVDTITGIDVCGRAVAFARANALLNGVKARFEQMDWKDHYPRQRYDHIVFNSPDAATAFEFAATGISRLLADDGLAQIWLPCEVLAEDGSINETIARGISVDSFNHRVIINENSPFSLSRQAVESGIPPRHTLLVSDPSKWRQYVSTLRARSVAEVASIVIEISHRS
jgi:SAM-dependent methyltransferase